MSPPARLSWATAKAPVGQTIRIVGVACRRVSWAIADQAASSLTNFAVGAVVARSLGATSFGVFTLAWVSYTLALNVTRGLATDPLLVRFSAVPSESWRAAVPSCACTALLVGLGMSGLALVAGLALGDPLRPGLVALAVTLPALLLQDSWRYAFFAAGQGQKALFNDLVWTAAMVPALVLAARNGTVFGFVFAWGCGGALAAGVGFAQIRVRPRLTQVRPWLRAHRDLSSRYVFENVSVSGASQIRTYGLGAIAGLAAVGTVRGAELLVGPFLMLMMGVGLVAVPEAARMLQRSTRHLWLFCLFLGVTQAGGALIWGFTLLLLPDWVGHAVLGSVWISAAKLIVPITLSVSFAGLCTAASTGLRALGAAPRSLRAQLTQSVGYAGGGLIGAAIAGAQGASWGTATTMGLAVVIWAVQLRLGIRQYRTDIAEPNIGDRQPQGDVHS